MVERIVFKKRCQEGKSFDAFVTELKKLVKSCDFEDQADLVVRDPVALGVTDLSLQEQMLRETDLNLSKNVELDKAAELSRMRARTIQNQIQKDDTKYRSGAVARSQLQKPSGERIR